MQDNEYDDDDFEEKSKSQVKRELNALKDLAKQLVSLPKKELLLLSLPENLLDVILQAQTLTHGPLKRELGYIGKCLADLPHDQISAQLSQPVSKQVIVEATLAEQWCEKLVAGDNSVLDQLYQDYPALDGQYIRQLTRNAQKEQSQAKPAKSAGLLLQYLTSLEANELSD